MGAEEETEGCDEGLSVFVCVLSRVVYDGRPESGWSPAVGFCGAYGWSSKGIYVVFGVNRKDLHCR